MTVTEFIAKWSASGAAERANKDSFLIDLCDQLGVPRPSPTSSDPDKDTYTFERDAVFAHEGDKFTTGKIDLFNDGHFILETKQGSEEFSKKLGSAKRGTPAWSIAMRDAYGQALGCPRPRGRRMPRAARAGAKGRRRPSREARRARSAPSRSARAAAHPLATSHQMKSRPSSLRDATS
jgi:hypothetical protein